MEIKRDKVSICNYICSALMVVLIVLQFIPYWSFGGQSAIINGKEYQSKKGQSISINSYVWSNPNNTDLVLYFADNVDEDIIVKEEANRDLDIPLVSVLPLKTITTLNETLGVYIKDGSTFKFKDVEIISKSKDLLSQGKPYAVVMSAGADELDLEDEVAVPFDEDLLKEEFAHHLDTVGGVVCWQITLAIIGIGFCLIKKKNGLFALIPLVNGINGIFGYMTCKELQLSSYWQVPLTLNILLAVFALITVGLHIHKDIKN